MAIVVKKSKKRMPPFNRRTLSVETMEEIIKEIAVNRTTTGVLRKHKIDEPLFFGTLHANDDLRKLYIRAKQDQCERWAEDINAVPYDMLARGGKLTSAEVGAAKLLADSLKWTLARVQPKRYGDSVQVQDDSGESAADKLRAALRLMEKSTTGDEEK